MLDQQDAATCVVSAKAVLFDWDGCLATGGDLVPGAREILLALAGRCFILSNNSTDHPRDLAAFLRRHGVPFPADDILLAGHQAVLREAKRSAGQTIRMVAAPQMIALAAKLGLKPIVDEADPCREVETVVVMRDTSFTFRTLTAAANAGRGCKRIVLSNPDLTHPGANGTVQPETGALYAAIRACLGDTPPDVEVIGKPSPELFFAALDRAGAAPGEAVMIGDNPRTDGEGARASGMPFVRVDPSGPFTMKLLSDAVCARLGETGCRSIMP